MAGLVVGCVGVHGSASTWVFNVARELLIEAIGTAGVSAGYAETVEGLPPAAAGMVVKTHHGSAGLDEWLAAREAKIVLSVRDPRDAAVSMAQRFGAPLERAVGWVLNDFRRAMRLAAAAALVLRYEDGFYEDIATAGRLARVLGLEVAPAAVGRIFEAYRTDAVRRFAANLGTLGPERVAERGSTVVDRVTNIHSTQIGDGRVGKWRELDEAAQGEMRRVFGAFLPAFGYGL